MRLEHSTHSGGDGAAAWPPGESHTRLSAEGTTSCLEAGPGAAWSREGGPRVEHGVQLICNRPMGGGFSRTVTRPIYSRRASHF